jgi:DNA-binding transcriptional ArsR family regulator
MKESPIPANLDLLFNALSNVHRREIVFLLSLQPASITDLAAWRNLSLQAIHKHINLLESAGMVRRVKSGRSTFLTLDRSSMRGLQEWINQFQAQWDGGSETLENYAETVEFKKQLKTQLKKEKK